MFWAQARIFIPNGSRWLPSPANRRHSWWQITDIVGRFFHKNNPSPYGWGLLQRDCDLP